MWYVGIVAIFLALYFREALVDIARALGQTTVYSKLAMGVLVLGILPLVFFDFLPASVVAAGYLYAVGLLGWQGYRIYREGRKRGRFLPRPCVFLPLCVLLLLITPLCDLFLGRNYPYVCSVVVGSATLAFGCLYLIEIYIRHPHLKS